jgi:excisionase family DNA binding protein
MEKAKVAEAQRSKTIDDLGGRSVQSRSATRLAVSVQRQPAAPHDLGVELNTSSSDEGYLSPRQAAAYLNSSPSTLAKLRCTGGGPAFTRIGRAVRYRRSDLDAWMAARLVTSVSHGRAAMAARGGR